MFFNPLQDELDEFGNIDYVCVPREKVLIGRSFRICGC